MKKRRKWIMISNESEINVENNRANETMKKMKYSFSNEIEEKRMRRKIKRNEMKLMKIANEEILFRWNNVFEWNNGHRNEEKLNWAKWPMKRSYQLMK